MTTNGGAKQLQDEEEFGFIERGKGSDSFFHHSAIKMTGFKSLNEGDKVSFDLELGNRGPSAKNVTVL